MITPQPCFGLAKAFYRPFGLVPRFGVGLDASGSSSHPPTVPNGRHVCALAQGNGQALMEHIAIDPESGQFLLASFAGYAMPRNDLSLLGTRLGGGSGQRGACGVLVT